MDIIKSKDDIEHIFATAPRYSHSYLRVLVYSRACIEDKRDLHGRVAVIAGKKLGNAPLRNRSKRVLRECARRNGLPYPAYDIILMATPKTASCSPHQLDAALACVFAKAGIQKDIQ